MMRHLILALAILFPLVRPILAAPTIFIVRHGEKAQSGDTKDPDLSDLGRARAEFLATMLKDVGITAIYATEFKRTQQTAAPLSRALNLKTTIVPAKETEALVAKFNQGTGNVLIIGHSNTIPEILKALGVTATQLVDEADYDNLFVLVSGSPAQLLHLHYR